MCCGNMKDTIVSVDVVALAEDYIYRNGRLLAAERVPEEGAAAISTSPTSAPCALLTRQDSKEVSKHDHENRVTTNAMSSRISSVAAKVETSS
jgi:hypothetical protein